MKIIFGLLSSTLAVPHPIIVDDEQSQALLARRQQNPLLLLQSVVQSNSNKDGLTNAEPGQAASATSNDNFINDCQGDILTNGLQRKGGSCNGIVMGAIPSVSNMISTLITNPASGATLQADQTFDVVLGIANMQTGSFTNPDSTYYAAPQQLNAQGDVIGHTHVTIQDLGATLNPARPLDAQQFAFFKGIDDAAVNGQLRATVTGGLKAGNYRVCTMSSASNHQAVNMPVAQRGAQDDCVRFRVVSAAEANQNGNENRNQNGNGNNNINANVNAVNVGALTGSNVQGASKAIANTGAIGAQQRAQQLNVATETVRQPAVQQGGINTLFQNLRSLLGSGRNKRQGPGALPPSPIAQSPANNAALQLLNSFLGPQQGIAQQVAGANQNLAVGAQAVEDQAVTGPGTRNERGPKGFTLVSNGNPQGNSPPGPPAQAAQAAIPVAAADNIAQADQGQISQAQAPGAPVAQLLVSSSTSADLNVVTRAAVLEVTGASRVAQMPVNGQVLAVQTETSKSTEATRTVAAQAALANNVQGQGRAIKQVVQAQDNAQQEANGQRTSEQAAQVRAQVSQQQLNAQQQRQGRDNNGNGNGNGNQQRINQNINAANANAADANASGENAVITDDQNRQLVTLLTQLLADIDAQNSTADATGSQQDVVDTNIAAAQRNGNIRNRDVNANIAAVQQNNGNGNRQAARVNRNNAVNANVAAAALQSSDRPAQVLLNTNARNAQNNGNRNTGAAQVNGVRNNAAAQNADQVGVQRNGQASNNAANVNLIQAQQNAQQAGGNNFFNTNVGAIGNANVAAAGNNNINAAVDTSINAAVNTNANAVNANSVNQVAQAAALNQVAGLTQSADAGRQQRAAERESKRLIDKRDLLDSLTSLIGGVSRATTNPLNRLANAANVLGAGDTGFNNNLLQNLAAAAANAAATSTANNINANQFASFGNLNSPIQQANNADSGNIGSFNQVTNNNDLASTSQASIVGNQAATNVRTNQLATSNNVNPNPQFRVINAPDGTQNLASNSVAANNNVNTNNNLVTGVGLATNDISLLQNGNLAQSVRTLLQALTGNNDGDDN